MTDKMRTKLLQYILTKQNYYEADVEKLQQHLRYGRIDAIDCIELIIALERKAHFDEIIGDILSLLRVFGGK
jgi:hypothetical protein